MPHLCRWCEFQSCLLFVISLLLKNFLTALHIIILVIDLWSIPSRGTWNYHLITKQNPDCDNNLVWHNPSLVGWGYKIKLGMIAATSQGQDYQLMVGKHQMSFLYVQNLGCVNWPYSGYEKMILSLILEFVPLQYLEVCLKYYSSVCSNFLSGPSNKHFVNYYSGIRSVQLALKSS